MDKVFWLVCWHLRQAHLEEIVLTQILAYHDSQTIVIGCHIYFQYFGPMVIFLMTTY
jgi:hypothetical protein